MHDCTDSLLRSCENLSDSALQVLRDMYGGGELWGTDPASPHRPDGITRISIAQGAALHKLVRDSKVSRSLEIGFAYGYSTVWILDALRKRDDAVHHAIDPFEATLWHGIGLVQASRVKTAAKFRWLPGYSVHALSRLIRSRESFDFIYIDGNHRFDDVLVDFYLSDQVTRVGGYIVFDDAWMDSIAAVCRFVARNRAYEMLPQELESFRVFRKLRHDDRDWRHFVPF